MSLFDKLKRRNVFRVAIAYVIVAWLVMQVADIVLNNIDAPSWVFKVLMLFIAIGFPFALIFTWALELTPEGLKHSIDVHPQQSTAPRITRRMNTLIVVGLVFVLALMIGANFWPQVVTIPDNAAPDPATVDTSPGETTKSVAVLPLFNLGGDPKDDYLGDGISGEVLNALSKLQGLVVIGRASSFQFRGRDIDAASVGRALSAHSLLSGTIQRDGDYLRISVELVDTASGIQLWSELFDRKFKNLFELEDDIASAVSKALAVRFGVAGRPRVIAGTANPRAHDLYLQARQLAVGSDEDSLNEAVIVFHKAIAEDPDYAAAWAGLASAYVLLADIYRSPADLLADMKGAAENAVALDPNLAEGHTSLGYILLAYIRDFPAARQELERGVALDAGSADAHFFLGMYWLTAGRDAAKARSEFQVAGQSDPLNPWHAYTQMWAAVALNDSAEAQVQAKQVLALDPDFFYDFDTLEYIFATSGRWQECIDRSQLVHGTTASFPDFVVAICHAHGGDTTSARAILEELESLARNRYVDRTSIAAIYAALGDVDGAFAALEQAYHDRSAKLPYLWWQPWFEPLYADPRFQVWIDRLR